MSTLSEQPGTPPEPARRAYGIVLGDPSMEYQGQKIRAIAGELIVFTGEAARHALLESAGGETPRRRLWLIRYSTYKELAAINDEAVAKAVAEKAAADKAKAEAEAAEAKRVAERAELEALVRSAVH